MRNLTTSEKLKAVIESVSSNNKEHEKCEDALEIANKELVLQKEEKAYQEQRLEELIKIVSHQEREQNARVVELSDMIKEGLFSNEEIQTKIGYIKQSALELEASTKELSDYIISLEPIASSDKKIQIK